MGNAEIGVGWIGSEAEVPWEGGTTSERILQWTCARSILVVVQNSPQTADLSYKLLLVVDLEIGEERLHRIHYTCTGYLGEVQHWALVLDVCYQLPVGLVLRINQKIQTAVQVEIV